MTQRQFLDGCLIMFKVQFGFYLCSPKFEIYSCISGIHPDYSSVSFRDKVGKELNYPSKKHFPTLESVFPFRTRFAYFSHTC